VIGLCGRDGKTGLAFVLMEPTRKNGKNSLADFGDLISPNHDPDSNMDALAITPVCLRVALTMFHQLSGSFMLLELKKHSFLTFNDFRVGYIPLSEDDPLNYLVEQQREAAQGFTPCLCSNCAPREADSIIELAPQITLDNMDEILAGLLAITKDTSIVTMQQKRQAAKAKLSCNLTPEVADILAKHLVEDF
jgi:hypothetical protein